jgi:hypothetical protein
MMILKRLAVWSIETLCEAVLLMTFLTALWREQSSLSDYLVSTFVGSLFFFMVGSGYLITTAIFGVLWRSTKAWVYPAIAATLFIVHVQFFATGWDPSTKVPVQIGGACIVFVCTVAGNHFMWWWVQTGSKQSANPAGPA